MRGARVQFAEINGTVLHYQLIGAPAGKPVMVFVNSLGTDFRIWRDVIVRLAGDFAIVVYDKRGHGLSGLGSAPDAIETHAADLAGLLDHLNVRGAIVRGLSIGRLISLRLWRAKRRVAAVRRANPTAQVRHHLPGFDPDIRHVRRYRG